MQKYQPMSYEGGSGFMEPDELGDWYAVADVDARIAELEQQLESVDRFAASMRRRAEQLEKALRDVRGELELYSGLRTEHQNWTDAFKAIDSALMVK